MWHEDGGPLSTGITDKQIEHGIANVLAVGASKL